MNQLGIDFLKSHLHRGGLSEEAIEQLLPLMLKDSRQLLQIAIDKQVEKTLTNLQGL